MSTVRPKIGREDPGVGDAALQEEGPDVSPLVTGLMERTQDMAVLLRGPQVAHVNRAFESVTGYHLADVTGTHPRALFGKDVSPRVAEAILSAAAQGRSWSGNCDISRKSGHELPVRLMLLPGGGPNGLSVLLATSNAGQEALDHDRRLQAVGQFTGRIAHSLNNHLTVIQAHVAAALSSGGALRQPELEELDRATGRAGALIAQLLLFSRRGSSRRLLIEVVPLLLRLVEDIRTLVPASVDVRALISERSGLVKTEDGCIEQVVLNLATNARDALPSGGRIQIEANPLRLERTRVFTTGVLDPGEYVEIAIRDSGAGMDGETQRQVFIPFFSTKPVGLGTGLGMPSVLELIRNNGGQIQIDSTPGAGTRVAVMLPQVREERAVPRDRSGAGTLES